MLKLTFTKQIRPISNKFYEALRVKKKPKTSLVLLRLMAY